MRCFVVYDVMSLSNQWERPGVTNQIQKQRLTYVWFIESPYDTLIGRLINLMFKIILIAYHNKQQIHGGLKNKTCRTALVVLVQ